MFNFDMSGKENFAFFKSDETKNVIFVETFDLENYEVRVGTLSKSTPLINFNIKNENINLNDKLNEIVDKNSIY